MCGPSSLGNHRTLERYRRRRRPSRTANGCQPPWSAPVYLWERWSPPRDFKKRQRSASTDICVPTFVGTQPILDTLCRSFLTPVSYKIRCASAHGATKAAITPRQSPRVHRGRNRTVLKFPTPARLPVGMDTLGLPFREPMLLRIGAAHEGKTRRRVPQTSDMKRRRR